MERERQLKNIDLLEINGGEAKTNLNMNVFLLSNHQEFLLVPRAAWYLFHILYTWQDTRYKNSDIRSENIKCFCSLFSPVLQYLSILSRAAGYPAVQIQKPTCGRISGGKVDIRWPAHPLPIEPGLPKAAVVPLLFQP